MKTTNKLGKSFGPVGSSAGYFLFLAGVAACFMSPAGLILIGLGAFLGFTSTSSIIDFEGRKTKFSENLFGIIPTGKWILIEENMTIGIKESNLIWTAYSRSNRSVDIDSHDFRLVLFDDTGKEIMPLAKLNTPDEALKELEIYHMKLNIKILE